MNNKLIDIHNNLMATLEDLDNPDLLDDPKKLEKLCRIAHAKSQVAKTIVEVDRLGFEAFKSADATLLTANNVLQID